MQYGLEAKKMDKLHWSKDVFGSKLELKQGDDFIGKIQWENMMSSKAQAIINGKLFMLNREFFHNQFSHREIFLQPEKYL